MIPFTPVQKLKYRYSLVYQTIPQKLIESITIFKLIEIISYRILSKIKSIDIVRIIISKGGGHLSIFRFTWIILLVFAGSIILAGCMNKEPAAEKMYQVLEKVVKAEKEFEDQQQPLVALEKQEQEIYNQIMTLGMKQHDEIVKLSNEALSIIEDRRVLLQKEMNSINASKTEFKKAEAIKNEIKVPEQKNKAEELLNIMTNRYKVHSELSKEYLNALDSDKELYTMLKNDGISYDKLEEHVIKLNTAYLLVSDKNEEFNDLTVQYNSKKLEFYKEAGLKLQTEE